MNTQSHILIFSIMILLSCRKDQTKIIEQETVSCEEYKSEFPGYYYGEYSSSWEFGSGTGTCELTVSELDSNHMLIYDWPAGVYDTLVLKIYCDSFDLEYQEKYFDAWGPDSLYVAHYRSDIYGHGSYLFPEKKISLNYFVTTEVLNTSNNSHTTGHMVLVK